MNREREEPVTLELGRRLLEWNGRAEELPHTELRRRLRAPRNRLTWESPGPQSYGSSCPTPSKTFAQLPSLLLACQLSW